MFLIRKKIAGFVAPVALVGALALMGCSGATEQPAGTGITDAAELQNQIDTWDDALDSSLKQLSLDLNANAAAGLKEINVLAWTADEVAINILVDDTVGTVSGAQLASVLNVLQNYQAPVEIGTYVVKGWDQEFYQGDSEQAAEEIGVNADFIDADWRNVVIPGGELANIYS